MDFSNKKYIKYKTKYIELKGGMSEEDRKKRLDVVQNSYYRLREFEKKKAKEERLDELEKERAEEERVQKYRLEKEIENENERKRNRVIINSSKEREKERAIVDFIYILDKIDINKNQLLDKIENVVKKDDIESKNQLLTILQEYKKEINNKKLAINKIKEVYNYIPSDIKLEMVFNTILR